MLCLALTGCQIGDGPVDPPPSPEPSQSESVPKPSGKLPKLPAKATKKTPKGAAAFTKHYYDLINYGRATEDWEPAKNVTLPSCQTCKDFWAKHPSRMDNERRILITAGPDAGRFDDPETRFSLLVTTEADPDRIPAEPGLEWSDTLWLDHRNGRWMVEDLEFSDLWPKSSE